MANAICSNLALLLEDISNVQLGDVWMDSSKEGRNGFYHPKRQLIEPELSCQICAHSWNMSDALLLIVYMSYLD